MQLHQGSLAPDFMNATQERFPPGPSAAPTE
jgi:hypothetical protein